MSFENIQIAYPNFCIGPQTGTFCYVDFVDIDKVYLKVVNNSGDLIRSYSFMPEGVFNLNSTSDYPYTYIVDLKYIGPRELFNFYTGAIFYTLERIVVGKHALDEDNKEEYSDRCIIRKWSLDNSLFTLNLLNTWKLNSNPDHYFDTFAFAIKVYNLSFATSVSTGTEHIEVNDASLLNIGDFLMLGPSSDMDNINALEHVYIYAINGNILTIRSFDGTPPTQYEYVDGDAITVLGNIYLFSNPRPLLGTSSGGNINVGTGLDGSLLITSANTILNSYTYITDIDIPKGIKYIHVEDVSIFSIDQEILIHQTQDSSDTFPGRYEFKKIINIYTNNNLLVFDSGLLYDYKSGNFNTLNADVTQVITVPNYLNITIKSLCSITCKAWDGYTGGIVVFRSKGVVLFEDDAGGIDVSAKGFRGGGVNGGLNNSPGDPGESYVGLGWHNDSTVSNCLANATGGGGGYGGTGYGGTGGGGGGAKNLGGTSTNGYKPPALAVGGKAFSFSFPDFLSFGGAGGGGGDDDGVTSGGCLGGSSGGIILIYSNVMKDAILYAKGEDGVNAGGSGGGSGGAGAGGSIFIKASNYSEFSDDSVSVAGGVGGHSNTNTGGNGSIGFSKVPLGEIEVITGYEGNGTLYVLDQYDYCAVVDTDENAKYSSVKAAIWSNTTGGLSFVKINNYMTVDIDDNYETIKSQCIKTITKRFDFIIIQALDYLGTDIYFLQQEYIKVDDEGNELKVSWTTYNYVLDTIIPYNYTTNLVSTRTVLGLYNQTTIYVQVRDQFNNGVYGANVFVSFTGDIGGHLDPLSGYVVTDPNGFCELTYTTGDHYTGETIIRAKVDKGNIDSGSTYTNCYLHLYQYKDYTGTVKNLTVEKTKEATVYGKQFLYDEATLCIMGYSKYIFGVGNYKGEYIGYDYDTGLTKYFNAILSGVHVYLLVQMAFPTIFAESVKTVEGQFIPLVHNYLIQLNTKGTIHLTAKDLPKDTLLLDQLTASRHLHDLNKDQTYVNQYVFIYDAIPAFWSEKIMVNTSIWLRMRPFAYSLNPNSLIFKIREYNEPLGIDTGYIDITHLGDITLFDAGSGLYGLDFNYQPHTFFHNESIIYVDVIVYDTAPIPNILHIDYWFKIIDDYKGPRIYNIDPPKESIVPLDTPISFYVTDDGIGLDINTLELFINDSLAHYTYELIDDNTYKIMYDTTNKYQYGSDISINVAVFDKSKYKNVTFAFWVIYFEDSTGPWVDMSQSTPKRCSRGIDPREDDISFQLYAIDNTGLDKYSIAISVASKDYTKFFNLLPIVYHKLN